MTAIINTNELELEYQVTEDQKKQFCQNGFIKLKHVLSAKTLASFEKIITKTVMEFNNQTIPMEERNTYDKAFIQVDQLWKKNVEAQKYVFSKRIAGIAKDLLGTKGVRLYHDQALYKEPYGGGTPWHVDQCFWPLATMKTVTAWIPFQDISQDMGPLSFAVGSQFFKEGRNMFISDEGESFLSKKLPEMGFENSQEPFNLGDISFHYGFTYHYAPKNKTNQMRKAMTIIYMDKDMTLKEPTRGEQNDAKVFCPGVKAGELIDTPLNPILAE